MELSSIGRYFGPTNSDNSQSYISYCPNITQLAVGAISIFGTAYFLNSEKTLGIPAKIAIAGAIIGSGLGICYLLRSTNVEKADETSTDTNITLENETSNNIIVNLNDHPQEATDLAQPHICMPVDPRFFQLTEKEEILLHHLRIKFCSIFIGIRSDHEAIKLRTEIENLYANLSKDQTILLSHSKDFWDRLTDTCYVKTIPYHLSAESFEILAEYCVHNNRKDRSRIHELNILIAYLNLETENLNFENKLLAITTYENKLIAIAKSGHPGIDEKIFTGKIAICRSRKVEILKIWETNKKRVTDGWNQEGTLSKTPSIKTVERSNSTSLSNPGNWPTEEIESFIKNVIETNDAIQFNQIETMDETSIKILIRKISLQTTWEKYWALEAQTTATSSVTKKRLERLLIILTTMADIKIKNSAKIDSFWLALSNTVNYTFSPEQKFFPLSAIYNFKNVLKEKIKNDF